LDLDAAAAASFLYITAPASAMVKNATLAMALTNPFILNIGTISFVGGANKTGSITWTITYQPVDSGAKITDVHTS
jgi:hypothetical protein